MINNNIYVVKETQVSEGIYGMAVSVFSNEKDAQIEVDKLNDEYCDYGQDPEDEFSEATHFYEYECFTLGRSASMLSR